MKDRSAQDGAAADVPLGDKVAFLSAPARHGGAAVDVRETRMAWVFLAGDRAYKLKKPIREAWLDHSTLQARARVCAEEVRLNRRLAPDVYLGTARLTLENGARLAIDGAGPVVDWLVVMRRLPDARMLDRAIADRTVTHAQILAVADVLAQFYAAAAPVWVDPDARVAALVAEIGASRAVFAEPRFGADGRRLDALAARLRQHLSDAPEIVTARIRAGRLVEGHGDLRPEHVCLETPPAIIDCLEFSRDLRCVDPFDEAAALGMECAALGARWIGPMVRSHLAARLGDEPSARTLAFHTAYRAILRARQTLAHLLAPTPRTPEKWAPLARRYLAQARAAAARLESAPPPVGAAGAISRP